MIKKDSETNGLKTIKTCSSSYRRKPEGETAEMLPFPKKGLVLSSLCGYRFFLGVSLFLCILFVTGCGGTNTPGGASGGNSVTVFDPTAGGISGSVTSSSSSALAGAFVETSDRQTTTNGSGAYLLYPLITGDYRLTARYTGYAPAILEKVRVNAGQMTENVNISMTAQATASAAKDFEVISITPFYGTDGDEIGILGKNIGVIPGRVTINGKDASVTEWNLKSDGFIRIRVPTEVESGEVKIVINNESSHETTPVRFIARPVAIEAKPASGRDGQKIAIIGRNFYPIINFNKVYLNGKSCEVLPDSTTKQLNVILPTGTENGTFQVKIESDAFQLEGISTAIITVPANIAYLSPARSLPGVTLALYGDHFGADKSAVKVNLGTKTTLSGNSILTFTPTKLTFPAPDNTVVPVGTSIEISLTIGNAMTASVTYTAYDPAIATLKNYGVFEFSTVASSNTVRLARLSPNDRLAFLSILCSDGSDLLDALYAYNATGYLGGNLLPTPTAARKNLPPSSDPRMAEKAENSPYLDVGPMMRSWAKKNQDQIKATAKPRISAMSFLPPATATFYVPNFASVDPQAYQNDWVVSATQVGTGGSSIVYLDDDVALRINATAANQLAAWFDNIYSVLTSPTGFKIAGNLGAAEGSIDDQPKIVLLVTPKVSNGLNDSKRILGYFNPRDKSLIATHSARTEIIYLNDDAVINDSFNLRGAMAHELQHMIYFNQKGNEGTTWINEGLSLVAQDIVGLGFAQSATIPIDFVAAYLRTPNLVSATHWPGAATDVRPENYGMAYLFMEYIYERCGGFGALRTLHTPSGKTGLADIITNIMPLVILPPPGPDARIIGFFNQFGLSLYCDEISHTTTTSYQFNNLRLRGAYNAIDGIHHHAMNENPMVRQVFTMSGFACDVIEYGSGNDGDVEFTLNQPPTAGKFKTWVLYFPR